jgi:hypothetical protein
VNHFTSSWLLIMRSHRPPRSNQELTRIVHSDDHFVVADSQAIHLELVLQQFPAEQQRNVIRLGSNTTKA